MPADGSEQVESFLPELQAVVDTVLALDVPGIAVEVVGPQGPLASLACGYCDVGRGDPVTGLTRFEIGSISKSCTALVLLSLAEEGLLDLDDPVTRWLPWFEVRSEFAPITLRHLLQHTAGLITGADAVPDDLAQAWELRHTSTGSAPGTRFHYSNAGYVVLGLVVEAVTGRCAPDLVAEQVLVPLGMRHSAARVTHADRARMATGYQPLHDDRPWLPGDPLVSATWFEVAAADGNVLATGPDLGRYVRMLLGRGTLDGARVATQDRFEEMTRSLAPTGEPSEHPSRYGLGVNVETVDGNICLTHGGGMVGYACFVLADLDAGLGVAVVSNAPGDSGSAELVARTGYVLARAHREGRPAPALPDLDPWRVPGPQRWVGRFGGSGLAFEVAGTPAGGLVLSDAAGSGRLAYLGDGLLGCTHPGWRTFHHRPAGDGDNRTWTYGGTVLRAGGADAATLTGTASPAGPAVRVPDRWPAHVGHYRSYSPWFTSFRIVLREGVLHLLAAGGVEAMRDEPELVELEPGVFRIGADPELPERLVVGPVVDGRTVWVSRDGCVYSRTFSD